MESKFFGPSDSSSDFSDDEVPVPVVPTKLPPKSAAPFSDDEDEPKRVVRSVKDKRFDEMYELIRVMKNHKKINDMCNILTDFEGFVKAFEKAKKVIEAEGIPRFYIKTIADLEDYVNQVWEDKECRKSMNKNNAKGLTSLRQRIRKYNRDFETEITDYRDNPDVEDEEHERSLNADESESEGDSEADDVTDFKKPTEPTTTKEVEVDDDDDSSAWSSSSEESSVSEEEGTTTGNYAARFLKKTVESDKKAKEAKTKKKREKVKKDVDVDEVDNEQWEEVRPGVALHRAKPKMFAKDVEINLESILKKLFEIRTSRGKKGTDRRLQIDLLGELYDIAKTHNIGEGCYVKIHIDTISAIFDVVSDVATTLKPEYWEKVLEQVFGLLDLLFRSTDLTLSLKVLEDDEKMDVAPYRIHGCIITLIERLDDEFTKILQNCDAHSTEYIERLRDEQKVCSIIEKAQRYCEKKQIPPSDLCRVYFRRLSHHYYKFNHAYLDTEEEQSAVFVNLAKKEAKTDFTDSKHLVDQLCMYIYAHSDMDPIRTQAILYQIYHHALHDRWYKARDLMQMSHLQDSIGLADIPLQIRFNRSLVQLGLCAFRAGFIVDAHNLLADIQSLGKAKELLAQGLLIQKHNERTPEQEKREKQRLLPYHMHINQELMECVYLVAAMLIEIPIMAANEYEPRRRMISRNFYHVMRLSERQVLSGPPETMREHVVAASKAMKRGDWQACNNYIINDKMNAKVWSLFHSADKVKQIITRKIQEESLRTYLFTYSAIYNTLSMTKLAEMFEVPFAVVHSIISKMIINDELMASLDEPTKMIIMHRSEPSHLQALALQLADKVTSLVDYNEKISETRSGTGYYKGSQQQQFNMSAQNWQRRQNRSYQQKTYY